MEIKAKCKYDYETCKAVSYIAGYKKSNPKKVVAARAIVYILLAVLNFAVIHFSGMQIGYGLILIGVVLLLLDLFMYFVMPRIQYNSMSKMKDVGNDYVFYDEEFTATTVSEHFSGQDVMKYSLIEKTFETGKYFFIYVNKRQIFVVDKATVEGGAAEDIREKLSSVLGKKYIRCKY